MKIIGVTGEKAIEELNRLQLEFTSSGLWPILIGDDEELERIDVGFEDSSESPSEILAASTAINAEKWFAERTSRDPELYQCEDGDWPEVDPGEIGIVTHLNISGSKPKKKVSIALLAIDNSFDSFAHLNWGGWNDCPFPQDHCAIHRYWRAKYGSEVVSITGDIVQCVVSNPPRDRDAAMLMAREQYGYCYDRGSCCEFDKRRHMVLLVGLTTESGSRAGYPAQPPHHRTCGSALDGSTNWSRRAPDL